MSDIIMPIFIPTNTEPDRCPKCHKVEDIKRVCRNCGHEYISEPMGVWPALLVGLGVLMFLFLLFGLFWWLMDSASSWSDHRPLFQVYADMVMWVFALRLW